jgi:hypothetical protein
MPVPTKQNSSSKLSASANQTLFISIQCGQRSERGDLTKRGRGNQIFFFFFFFIILKCFQIIMILLN